MVSLSGCMEHGPDQQLDVGVVDTGEGVPEIDGDATRQTGGEPEHPLLAPRTGETTGVEGIDCGWPVDAGGGPVVEGFGAGGDEAVCEVGAMQPLLRDQQVSGGGQAV